MLSVHSHRTRSIQPYHPHCNELAILDRATAKRTRKTSKLSQLHATNFARICIDVHVQVLRDRVVAKLAKLLSRWRTPVIKDGAEFCIWWIRLAREANIITLAWHWNLPHWSRMFANPGRRSSLVAVSTLFREFPWGSGYLRRYPWQAGRSTKPFSPNLGLKTHSKSSVTARREEDKPSTLMKPISTLDTV